MSSLDNRGKGVNWLSCRADWDVAKPYKTADLELQTRCRNKSIRSRKKGNFIANISLLNFYFHSRTVQRMLIDRTFGMPKPKWWSTKITFIFRVTWVDFNRDERNTHARPDRIFDTTTIQCGIHACGRTFPMLVSLNSTIELLFFELFAVAGTRRWLVLMCHDWSSIRTVRYDYCRSFMTSTTLWLLQLSREQLFIGEQQY